MSSCRRMTHEDVGAPPFYGYKRDGLYAFLDTVFLTGYNEKFVLNYSRTDRVLTLNYAEPHGYEVGQLLAFSGSLHTPLNINHRVTEVPSTNALKIYIKDDAFASYPEASSETGIQTKVAPFGWEKVYESATQRSYRSRATDSSKIVVTFKKPTYHATTLATTAAVCYEVDVSKNIDLSTGSPIDSCFVDRKSIYGHTCSYFVASSNQDNLSASPNWNHDTHRTPWTLIGDERFVYFIYNSYVEGQYENGNYRQWLKPAAYNANYRHPFVYAFGDIVSYDAKEYLTGSSFFFKFFNFYNNSVYENTLTNIAYRPFLRGNSYNYYTYFYSNYDPKGVVAGARLVTAPTMYSSTGEGASCGYSNYIAYPQRITGGLNYYDYSAYENDTSTVNTPGMFYKGVFPYSKYSDSNLRSLGVTIDLHNKILPTEFPYRKLFLSTAHPNGWYEPNYYGNYLFELD